MTRCAYCRAPFTAPRDRPECEDCHRLLGTISARLRRWKGHDGARAEDSERVRSRLPAERVEIERRVRRMVDRDVAAHVNGRTRPPGLFTDDEWAALVADDARIGD